MPSKLAGELLEKIDQGDGMLTALETIEYEDLIDAELQEVRNLIMDVIAFTEGERSDEQNIGHRARALMARLRVDGGKENEHE